MSLRNQGMIAVPRKWRRNSPLVTLLSLQISHQRAKSRDHISTGTPSRRLGLSSSPVTAMQRAKAKPAASHSKGMHTAARRRLYEPAMATAALKAKAGTVARSRTAQPAASWGMQWLFLLI